MDLATIIDELSIRRLADTFCDGVNSRDHELWASVWADDGATFCLGRNDIVGKEAIIAGFTNGITAYDLLVQVATNGRIEVEGDTATGRWYMLELTQLRDGPASQMVGLCHDDYTRTPDGWRLKRREVERIYKGAAPLDGWTRPITD